MSSPGGAPVALSAAPPSRAFIGMGGNLGDVRAHLLSALAGLNQLPGTRVEAVSSLYQTRPVDAGGPDYLNAVAAIQSSLGPHELLSALMALEAAHDRSRSYQNAPRTLDLDLLWFGAAQRHTPRLTLPHPRMSGRAFVLEPLAEVIDCLKAVPGGSPGVSAAACWPDLPDLATRQGLAAAQGIALFGSLGESF